MTYLEKVALLGNNATTPLKNKLLWSDYGGGKHDHIIERHTVTAGESTSGIIDFTTIGNVIGGDVLKVFRNGNLCDLTTDYAETNATRVTFIVDPYNASKSILETGDALKFEVKSSGVNV